MVCLQFLALENSSISRFEPINWLRGTQMHRRGHRHQPSLADFSITFGGKLSGDNRWIHLAQPIARSKLEDYYAAQFVKVFGAPGKPLRMALSALII
jgi:hypothetical protein